MFFVLQPPPAITDKQLDEREHTVEEWKGENHLRFSLGLLISSRIDLSRCVDCCLVSVVLPVAHLFLSTRGTADGSSCSPPETPCLIAELIYKEVLDWEERTKNGVIKGQPASIG